MSAIRRLIAAFVLGAVAAPAHANDSEAAIGIGGLELVKNAAISMDSEDLYISRSEVRVRYRFTNHSAKDIETLVSFPLPAVPGDNAEYYYERAVPDFKALDFQTTVDGKPIRLDMIERAEIAGKDISARLKVLGWPVNWIEYSNGGGEPDFVTKLSPQQKAAYRAEGLLKLPYKNAKELVPAWSLVTHVTRKQTFPAGRTIEVTHRYVPMAGGSVGGALEPQYREDYPEHARRYCTDGPFLTAFDRKIAARKKAYPNWLPYSEIWLSYVLSSGRNWAGPIKDFRLVVDKGKAENMVSLCMSGVKKINPTQFEVRKTNFEPKGDLDILIIEWPVPEE